MIATFAAYDIGYNLIYGLGLLLTVLTFTLTLLIDNFFLLLEAASIITGYVAAGACVVASIACFNMAISNDKKNKLESADIEYDQNCLVFYTSKDERYVLTEIKTIYAKGEKYHIDGKAAKYTTQLGKSHTVHLDIIPATYQNCIYLCDILNNITQGTNQNKSIKNINGPIHIEQNLSATGLHGQGNIVVYIAGERYQKTIWK